MAGVNLHEDRSGNIAASGQALVVCDGEVAAGQRWQAVRPRIAEAVAVEQMLMGVEKSGHTLPLVTAWGYNLPGPDLQLL